MKFKTVVWGWAAVPATFLQRQKGMARWYRTQLKSNLDGSAEQFDIGSELAHLTFGRPQEGWKGERATDCAPASHISFEWQLRTPGMAHDLLDLVSQYLAWLE
jgi:hypothetical protein